jgi:adenosylcobinamide-GDP ribazoletransferase
VRDALRLAVGTLTALPTRPPVDVDNRVARAAMLIAPVTVLPLAVVWFLGHAAMRLSSIPPLLVGVLVVATTALYSRGLHLDGLADTADGLAASHDRDRALAVMKTGDVGPNGAAALVLALLVQAVALGSLLTSAAGTALAVVTLLASRHCLAWGCWSRVPTARPTGLGASVGSTVPTAALLPATTILIVLAAGIGQLFAAPWYAGPLAVVVALSGAGFVLRTAIRRLGGMTGDILGACVEVSLTASLVAATVTR